VIIFRDTTEAPSRCMNARLELCSKLLRTCYKNVKL
jgi:hypothetical protein